MGANVSTQISSATTAMQNVQKTKCQNDSNIDQSIGNINISLVGANCGNIEISNTANVSQTCDLGATASALAQAAQGLTAEQKASLSLSANVSTGVQNNTTTIQQIIEQECGNSTKIAQKIKGANITLQPYVSPDGKTVIPASCDILKFANSASAQEQCILKTITDSVAKLEQKQEAKQTQESIGSLISGLLLGPLLIILIPVVLIGGIVFVMRMMKKPATPMDMGKLGAKPGAAAATPGSSSTGASIGKQASGFGDAAAGVVSGISSVANAFKSFKTGGGRAAAVSVNTENIPIVVFAVLMLVWYAKMTEQEPTQYDDAE